MVGGVVWSGPGAQRRQDVTQCCATGNTGGCQQRTSEGGLLHSSIEWNINNAISYLTITVLFLGLHIL